MEYDTGRAEASECSGQGRHDFIPCQLVCHVHVPWYSFPIRSSIEKGENRTLAAVVVSAPFILVRIIYAMLLFFLANSTFNMIDGNNTVQLVMSVFDELIVVFVCLAVGFTLGVREKHWKSVPGLEVA
jgi:hypothetical protein